MPSPTGRWLQCSRPCSPLRWAPTFPQKASGIEPSTFIPPLAHAACGANAAMNTRRANLRMVRLLVMPPYGTPDRLLPVVWRFRRLVTSLDFYGEFPLLSHGCRAPIFAPVRTYSHLFALSRKGYQMSVRKRTWRNADGSQGEAWVAAYTDHEGKRRIRSFEKSARPTPITPASHRSALRHPRPRQPERHGRGGRAAVARRLRGGRAGALDRSTTTGSTWSATSSR